MTLPTQSAEVVEIRHLCPDVREMVLRPRHHAVPFVPGQWVSVYLPAHRVEAGDKPVVRAYTLAEPPSDDGTLVLCFDRVKEGAASSVLFEVGVGDCLTISDALGNFVRPEKLDGGVAFVTWFTGIVPMRCMLLEMVATRRGAAPTSPPTLLVYGAPNREQLPYDAQLRALAAEHPWFTYVAALPAHDGEGPAAVLRELPAAIDQAFPDGAGPGKVHPMIAGIRAVVLPARAWFMDTLGYSRAQVQKETYD